MTASGKKIRLILADDEPVARAGIRAILSQANDIEVIGEAQDGFEAKRMVAELRPRILLLDLRMPGPRPAELEKWVRENYPETVALVLTAHDRDAYLANMIDAGVSGYLTKSASDFQLIDALRRTAQGTIYFDEEQISRAAHWNEEVGNKWKKLTEREREVLQLLAQGADNKAIASELSITARTVESHVAHILAELEVDSRQKAALWMVANFPDEMTMDGG
ncbi:MAG: DNA-binding response regulator [Anaerolineae bacterium CG03_land_8_20_14_0_80_58_20]|nr:MAG: DNA-binding response regulator [Anaerolineae bacterium CG03_land_8_20_14_0_80_58_20]